MIKDKKNTKQQPVLTAKKRKQEKEFLPPLLDEIIQELCPEIQHFTRIMACVLYSIQ